MELKEIASISGKPGLFKIVKPTRSGVIVETLDDKKNRTVVGTSHRVSLLKEVSIYTTGKDAAISLEEVLFRIYQKYKDSFPLTGKSDGAELEAFMAEIVPDYDKEKVYTSDMKKLVNWYSIILKYTPVTFETLMKEEEVAEKIEEEKTDKKEKTATDKAEKKTSKTKTEDKPAETKAKEKTGKEKTTDKPIIEVKAEKKQTKTKTEDKRDEVKTDTKKEKQNKSAKETEKTAVKKEIKTEKTAKSKENPKSVEEKAAKPEAKKPAKKK